MSSIFGNEVPVNEMPPWTRQYIKGRPRCYIRLTADAVIPTNMTDWNVRYIFLKAPDGKVQKYTERDQRSAGVVFRGARWTATQGCRDSDYQFVSTHGGATDNGDDNQTGRTDRATTVGSPQDDLGPVSQPEELRTAGISKENESP
jgi:hypothetical protein